MRTYYEIEETGAYLAARDLLLRRYGLAKTVAMSARDRGPDIGDPEALTAFLGDVPAGVR